MKNLFWRTLLRATPIGTLLTIPVYAQDDLSGIGNSPSEIIGIYSPSGSCSADLRMIVHKSGAVLLRKDEAFAIDKSEWEICYSCAGGARYEGIERWAHPPFDGGNTIPLFRFNADEEDGFVVIENFSMDGEPLPSFFNEFIAASPLQRCGLLK